MRVWLRSVVSLSLVLLIVGVGVTATRIATARDTTEPLGKLVVTYQPNPAVWPAVQPGDVMDWQLRVSLVGADTADLALQLSGRGPLLAEELEIKIEQCPLTPTISYCELTPSPVLTMPVANATGAQQWQLAQLDLTQDVLLLVQLRVPMTAYVSQERTEVGIGLIATGDIPGYPDNPTTSAPPASPAKVPPSAKLRGPLAATGVDILGPGLLGLGLIGLGLVSVLSSRQRRETS